jgi:hypothetical protein
MRKSEFLMLEELKSAPHLNDSIAPAPRGGRVGEEYNDHITLPILGPGCCCREEECYQVVDIMVR